MPSRRQFLMGAAAMAAAPAMARARIPLGLQLYTLRDDLAKDFEGTLKAVRDMGIRLVQSNLSMNGRDSRTLRKLYDDMGFTWDSIHAGGDALRNTPQATIDEARAAGLKNITCSFPLYPVDRAVILSGPSLDDWKRDAETYNKVGELCHKAGLSFGYHNHNVEFRKIGDVLPYDLLLKETDPALVSMEMDIGWVVAAGADPVAYLTKYPKRYSSLHIKDLKAAGIPNTNLKMVSAVIGEGIVPWDKIIPAAHKAAVRDAYLELEGPYVPTPTAMVKASFDWMKTRI